MTCGGSIFKATDTADNQRKRQEDSFTLRRKDSRSTLLPEILLLVIGKFPAKARPPTDDSMGFVTQMARTIPKATLIAFHETIRGWSEVIATLQSSEN